MSGSDDDVPRWLDDPLPTPLRNAVSGLAAREPDLAARARLARALAPQLGGGGSGGAAAGRLSMRLALGAAVVAGLATFLAWKWDAAEPRLPVVPIVQSAIASPDAGVEVVPEPNDPPPPPTVTFEAPEPRTNPESRRAHGERRAPEQQPVPPPADAVAPPVERPPSEAALLLQARAVVEREPRVALRLVDEHQRLYARGLLAQEREVLRVEALVGLGRLDEARQQADAFLVANPRSALRQRVETLRGEAVVRSRQ